MDRVVIVDDITGEAADIIQANGSMGLTTVTPGHVSTDNSTTTTLGGDAVYTGTWEDITNHGIIVVTVKASHASATDGLKVCFSPDGVNCDSQDTFTIPAATGKTFSFQAASKFFRVEYTNGSTEQTYFRLQTILKPYYVKPSSHRIADAISAEDDAELQKAVLTALNPSNSFVNINATASGNLKVANVEDGLAIAKGDVTDTTFVHKFGNAPDFATGDGAVTVWDGADEADIAQMNYVYSSTADIDSVSSSSGSDTFDLQVFGLDSDWNEISETVTLTGQTRKALANTYIRINRMINTNSSDNVGHIYCYVNTAISSGVPTDTTKVRSVIQPGNNQTLQAVYSVPAGKTGYMRDWYMSTAGANKSSNFVGEVRVRPFGGVFQLKHITAISDDGTSAYQHRYNEPEVIAAKSDIEMRCSVTAVGVTAASVSAGFDLVLVG